MSQFSGSVLYRVVTPTIAFLVFSYIAAVAAIILNIVEIHMIVKKWKKASDFEIVLLNLAVADLLSGFGFLAATGVTTWSYVIGRRETHMITFVGLIVLFSVSSSMTFVIVIAGERLSAVKHPLKHRIWHSNRRNLFKACLLTWLFNIFVICGAVLTDRFITGVKGSENLTYATGGYMTLGIAIVFVLYTWLGHLVMRQSTRFLAVDKNDLAANAKGMKRALKKERATIVVCTLVVVLFLTCNIPFTVGIYQLKMEAAQTVLLKLSATVNPLIYFFKGRLEKYYAKRKINLSSGMKTRELQQKHLRNGNVRNGNAETMIDISSTGQSLGAKVKANKEANSTNKTFHRSDTLKVGKACEIEKMEAHMGSSIGGDDTDETLHTASESLKIELSLKTGTGVKRRENGNGTLKIRGKSFQREQISEMQTGSNKNGDDTDKTACESLKIEQSLQTKTGPNMEENNGTGKFQERVDDNLREGFNQGIVNMAYDVDTLNIGNTKL